MCTKIYLLYFKYDFMILKELVVAPEPYVRVSGKSYINLGHSRHTSC
jgi:hypothetical protein